MKKPKKAKRAPRAAPAGPASFFNTHATAGGDRLGSKVIAEHQKIMERSFQRVHGDLKSVDPGGKPITMDKAVRAAMDNNIQQVKATTALAQNNFLPFHQVLFFSSCGFIGWQMCAIVDQHWLVNKTNKMPAADAVRHGWELSINDGTKTKPKFFDDMRKIDKRMKLKQNLMDHCRFGRMFGVRHTLFIVDDIDYEAPFNIDGVKSGSYRGMTQIDPYWLAPEFSIDDAANPASPHFYEPTWWRVNGKRVHRSHFVITRNMSDPADILKPTYFYGGISTTQKILERVYAAERTANEAPLLAMSKRMITLTLDDAAALGDLTALGEKMEGWMAFMNNFGVKVLGTTEKIEQFETSLAEFDATIMTQYQLVSAAGEVPATKLLGTSPKGFNATGEYDEKSYDQFLESWQENELSPLVERHNALAMKSEISDAKDPGNCEVQWNATGSLSAKERADINKTKAETDNIYSTIGAVDGYDVRAKISADSDSGYNGIPEVVPGGPGDRDHEQELQEQAIEGAKNNDDDTAKGPGAKPAKKKPSSDGAKARK